MKKNKINLIKYDQNINVILSNVFLMKEPGLSYGKMGVAIYIANYISKTKDDSLEDILYNLILNILSNPIESINYKYGSIGIGIGLMYLINNRMIDADYHEIYSTQHKKIIEDTNNKINHLEIDDAIAIKIIDKLLYVNYYENTINTKYRIKSFKINESQINTLSCNPLNIKYETTKYEIIDKLIRINDILNSRKQKEKIGKIILSLLNDIEEYCETTISFFTLMNIIEFLKSRGETLLLSHYIKYYISKHKNLRIEIIDIKEAIDAIISSNLINDIQLSTKEISKTEIIKEYLLHAYKQSDDTIYKHYNLSTILTLKGGLLRYWLYNLSKNDYDKILFI